MPLVVNPESTFRLVSLWVRGHPILGDISLTFDNDVLEPQPSSIYTTVIIGANGIGKTYLLTVIVGIFNYLYELNNSHDAPRSLGYDFEISYWYNDHLFSIKTGARDGFVPINARVIDKIVCLMDDNPIGAHNCLLPNVVVASSMTVNDKFPVKSLGDMYHYQGIREENSPNRTGTKTLIRRTVDGLINCLKVKGGFREELRILLDVLGLQHSLKIQYQFRYKNTLLTEELNPQLLCAIIDNHGKRFFDRETDLWGKRFFDKEVRGDGNKLERICEFYRRMARTLNIDQSRLSIVYDVFEQEIERDAEVLRLLSKMDFLSSPAILVSKQNQYDFVNSSSGETHLLCQMIGIMSVIKKGGVVLIDEPETSSHPNWQIQYIGWLKSIFREYKTCHFIISTHSHFLLSDLEPESSTIIALDRSEGELKNIGEGLNTFCWSTDEILYKVFHIRNTRNAAFERDVTDLYDRIIKKDSDIVSIKLLLERLSKYQLDEKDPLLHLITFAENYVKTI